MRTATALVVSLFLHLPLMPIVLLIGLMARIDRAQEAAQHDYRANEATISVELLSPLPSTPPSEEAAALTMDSVEPSTLSPLDIEERAQEEPAEQSEPSLEEVEADGSLGSLEDEANVTLSLWVLTMRQHPLGPTLRALLGCGKLGATLRRAELEAFSDIEAAVFAGPRLDDPTQYTAALSHHLSPARLRKSFARLTWPHGKWLDDSAVRIQAAGASRVVFQREPSLVLATPETVWKKLKTSTRPMAIPPPRGRAFSLTLREPAMALARLGLDLPLSLSRMRLDVYPRHDGGVELRIRFDDRDEATAKENAPKLSAEIEAALRQLRQVASLSRVLAPLLGARANVDFALPRMQLGSEGAAIVGRVSIDAAEAEKMLSKLTPFVCETSGPARARPSPTSVR